MRHIFPAFLQERTIMIYLKTKKDGFTLIELLVVIVIIAVLASILFPVFARAREKARLTTCLSNQRQLAQSALMYAQDHEETLPPSSSFWQVLNASEKSLKCPSAAQSLLNSYICNTEVDEMTLGNIADPSAIWLTADGTTAGIDRRHHGKAAASYVDGHVEINSFKVIVYLIAGWGDNTYGQLGNNSTTNVVTPWVTPTYLGSVLTAASGRYHTLAVKADGSVWSWGDNTYGQLGNGTNTQQTTPVQVTVITSAVSVAGGGCHSLMLKSDGTVWSWGDNTYGQLGDGTNIQRVLPVQVIGITGAKAIAAGRYFSLALKADGTVWAWGDNTCGQLGDGTTISRNIAQQVYGVTNAIKISAGGYSSLALKLDGTVIAWGDNIHGQLGDGSGIQRTTAVSVTGISGIVTLATGEFHCLALKSDGSVWAWGDNMHGQLGDGSTTTVRTTPVQITGLTSTISLATGGGHSLALTSDHSVWAWGDNGTGNLGDGTTLERNTPVKVVNIQDSTALVTGCEDHNAQVLIKQE